ncbi:MAG: DUF2059 domain-containing protein [Hyphomicrobiaceae bacterium]|nr:DUF2059 domain-containing protein [Hyphomicrobiaceae bacterium]MCC0010752.1 DUF2059 domain-containing protein [Hyphomicrobiaceae bacterium]
MHARISAFANANKFDENVCILPRSLKQSLVFFLTILAMALVTPASEARESVSVAKLAEISGMIDALDEMADAIAGQAEQITQEGDATGEPAEFLAAWKKAANKGFSADTMKAEFLKRLEGKLAPDETNAVTEFYVSDLGKKLVAAETASASDAGQQEMASLAPSLMEGLAKEPARKAVLDKIAAVTNLNELMTSMTLNVSRAVLIGMATADTSSRRMTLEDISQVMAQQKPTIAKQSEAMAMLSLAHAYKDMSVDDLEKYGNFLATPAGGKFIKVTTGAIDAVMSGASLTFGKLLAAELGRTPI